MLERACLQSRIISCHASYMYSQPCLCLLARTRDLRVRPRTLLLMVLDLYA
jgi:hypothetical protein